MQQLPCACLCSQTMAALTLPPQQQMRCGPFLWQQQAAAAAGLQRCSQTQYCLWEVSSRQVLQLAL